MSFKVLHIITKLELGGAQGNTIYTVRNINREKFLPILVFGSGGILDSQVISDKSIEKRICPHLVREISPIKDILALIELYFIIRKEKPDIVHTHSSKAGILARIAAWLAGVKIIMHTFHGFGFHERQKFFVKKFYILLEKICAFFSSSLIFVSKANMEIAKKEKIGKESTYILIRSGIKLEKYRKASKDNSTLKALGIKQDQPCVVSLGNLKPQKNPEDFIKTAKIVLSKNKKISFLYIGGGERLEYFRAEVQREHINENCFFTGWVDAPEKYLAACDIFILTSLWEGLPRSLVEAMSCSLAPVCYKTDGVRDLIVDGENGFLINQGDVVEMASKILLLAENETLRKKISSSAGLLDLSEFDIDLMVRKQEELYLRLLGEK